MESKTTGELVHRCKYGLVELWPENYDTMQAWKVVRVFGPEAGMRLLAASLGQEKLAAIAHELVALQSAQNGRDRERVESERRKARNANRR